MARIGRLSRTLPRSRLARLVASPAVRVWGWVVLLALLALVLGILTLQHEREFAPPFSIPWLPIMAVAFFLGEANVVQVHFRRERHSFSLSELPGVIGLFVLPPSLYLVALLTGAGVALFRGGSTSTLKRSFNLANFALTAVVSLALFHSIARLSGVPGPQDWLAAFATTTATSLIGAVAVATAISLSGGAPQYQKLPEMLQFSLMVALANTSLALLAVTVLWVDPRSIVLLVVPSRSSSSRTGRTSPNARSTSGSSSCTSRAGSCSTPRSWTRPSRPSSSTRAACSARSVPRSSCSRIPRPPRPCVRWRRSTAGTRR